MAKKRAIANSIESLDLSKAIHDIVSERWANWDLAPYLVYLIDCVDSSFLPYLADQFDVGGLAGFIVAGDEDALRELIKRSIDLHKRYGTPWVLKEAFKLIGYTNIIIEEGVTEYYGGPTSPEDWARFRILLDPINWTDLSPDVVRRLRSFINIYKPERSHLAALGYLLPLGGLGLGPVFTPIAGDTNTDKIYDGTYEYDGEIDYGVLHIEDFELTIIGYEFMYVNPESVTLDYAAGNSGVFSVRSNIHWIAE